MTLLFAGSVLVCAQMAHAQTVRPKASNYQMPTDVQAVGGGEGATSTFYILDDTIGEANIGPSRSTTYDLNAGYRQTVADAYIALSCDDTADMGTIMLSGRANGSATCTVITDADAGYALSWRAGTNNTNELFGHWKLDETSGTTAYDSSGNQNNGTYQNMPTVSTSIPSNYVSTRSLSFNGTSQYVSAPNLNWPSGGAVTVSFWNYVTTAQVQASSAFDVGSNNADRFQVHAPWSDSRMYWDYGTIVAGRLSADYTSYLNKWTHVTLVSAGNGGNFKAIYLDGKLVVSGASSDGPDVALTGLKIGRADLNTTNFHKGNLDDLRIYDRVLSYAEIQSLASKASPGSLVQSGSQVTSISPFGMPFTGGLLGHWKFDEISSGGATADSSGFANDGTPSGASGTNNKPQPSVRVPSGVNHITARSMDFDGTDDQVDAGNGTSLQISGNTMTASAWVHVDTWPTVGNYPAILSKVTGVSPYGGYQINLDGDSGNKFACGMAINSTWRTQQTTGTYSTGTWYNVVCMYDGANLTIYVNGVADGTSPYTGAIQNVSANVLIGKNGGSAAYVDGAIDDVRVYSRALSALEIAALNGIPQTWTVANTDARWGARLSSTSTDTDAKWGADNSTDTWLNVGEGNYPLVTRSSRTSLSGSTEVLNFRTEIGAVKIQRPGVYNAAIVLTASAL